MLGHDVPEPKFWKALVAMLCIALPVALLSHELIRESPIWLWLIGAVLLAFCGAYNLHRKARYDAAAQWNMNFTQADRSTYVPRDTRIDRK